MLTHTELLKLLEKNHTDLLKNIIKYGDIDIIRFFILSPLWIKLEILQHLITFPEHLEVIIYFIPSLTCKTKTLHDFWYEQYINQYVPIRNERLFHYEKKIKITLTSKEIYEKLNNKKTSMGIVFYKLITRKESRNLSIFSQNCREKRLEEALDKVGLEIRNDSKLCNGWIKGYKNIDESWNLESIVKMCIEMKWLYEYTPYRSKIDAAIPNKQQEIYEKWLREDPTAYKRDEDDEAMMFHDAWGEARNIIEPEIRKQILIEYPIPEILPWLN